MPILLIGIGLLLVAVLMYGLIMLTLDEGGEALILPMICVAVAGGCMIPIGLLFAIAGV